MKFLPYRILPTGNGHWQVVDMRDGRVVEEFYTRREARSYKWELEAAESESENAVVAPR